MKSMIFSAIIALAFHAQAEVSYSNQVVLPTTASQFKLVSAQYDLIPTKTETRRIPGCRENGEASTSCTEIVAIESQAVIRVDVSYRDSSLSSDVNDPQWASVNFKTDDFPAADVALLKSVYPAWKNPSSLVATKYASNFSINVTNTKNVIRVVDMKKSKICRVNDETGEILPGCVERLVYKNAESPALLLTVSRK